MRTGNQTVGTIYALVGFLLLQTVFGEITLITKQMSGWNAEFPLLLLDRLLYLLIIPVGGALLYLRLPGPVGIERTPFERPEPRPSPWVSGMIGGLIGILLFLALLGWLRVIGPEKAQPTMDGFSWELLQSPTRFGTHVFSVGIVTPILEEIFYRAVLLRFLLELKHPPATAIVLQALCFGFSHPLPVVPVLTLIGLLLGVLYWRTGLGSSILAHSGYNLLILFYARL